MKRLLSAALLVFASTAFGATLTPIQLLNPSGSTAGQFITSAGPAATPTWSSVTLSGLGGVTAAQAAAAAPVQSVAGRTGAVTLGVADVSGAAPLASPTFTGTVTIPAGASITKPNIVGTTAADNAAAGVVGEIVSNTVSSATAMTSSSFFNVTSVALPAGDWEVEGTILLTPASSTPIQIVAAGISTVSATFGAVGTYSQNGYGSGVANQAQSSTTPSVRINVASPTTVYLVGYGQFSVSTCSYTASLRAKRVR